MAADTWKPDNAAPCYRRSPGGRYFAVVRQTGAAFGVSIQSSGETLGPYVSLDDAKQGADEWCTENDPAR